MNDPKGSILVVDDNEELSRTLARTFERKGWTAFAAFSGKSALKKIREEPVDVLLADLRMPGMDGLELIRAARALVPGIEAVILSGYGTIPKAVEAMKEGACDFLVKPVKVATLVRAAQRALSRRTALVSDRNVSPGDGGRLPRPIVGRSPAIRKVLDLAARAASSSATVLIEGESGSGKELLAEAIHHWSPRGDKPLVKVSCATLPETLVEAEIFGYERGAFTGAYHQRRGRFELAHGGTIFLDEIGQFSPALQVKLLRVLQNGEFERLGGNRTLVTDARVIAATNVDLDRAVHEGTFRKDLFYRLNVVRLRKPALRERPEDIPVLVNHFIDIYRRKNAKNVRGITGEALALMCAFQWPGNVRELEHAVERAVVMCSGSVIGVEDLPESLLGCPVGEPTVCIPVGMPLEEIELKMIEETLRHTGGDKRAAADLLGIARRTIYRKLNRNPKDPTQKDEN